MHYLYVHFNNCIAANTTGSYCLKSHQTCSKSSHSYTACSNYPSWAHTKMSDVDELKRCIKNEWADLNHAVMQGAVGDIARYFLYALAFLLEADILSITTCLTIVKTTTSSLVCNYSLIH